MCRPIRTWNRGRLTRLGETSEDYAQPLHRGSGGSMYTRKARATREAPCVIRDDQPDAREGQAGRSGVAERLVVPLKLGNAGGGKGPWFKTDAQAVRDREIGQPNNSKTCSEAADGVARESEGRSRLSLLCPVRQDQPWWPLGLAWGRWPSQLFGRDNADESCATALRPVKTTLTARRTVAVSMSFR
jgi:hypothetical protein